MVDKKIQLMIIGAQKSGTSSLKSYIGLHPDICVHSQEEITYFINNDEYAASSSEFLEPYYGNHDQNQILLGKSAGLMYNQAALERLKNHNPDVKIVMVLRNPIDRAYSAFWYARRKGWEPLESFEGALHAGLDRFGRDWIRQSNCDYLNRGEYSTHLETIFKLFPKDNVLIYKFEELKQDALKVCQEIWCELGVDDNLKQFPEISKKHNISSMPKYPFLVNVLSNIRIPKSVKNILPLHLLRKFKRRIIKWNEIPFSQPPIKTETRMFLLEYFKKFNNELAELTDIDFNQ